MGEGEHLYGNDSTHRVTIQVAAYSKIMVLLYYMLFIVIHNIYVDVNNN